MIYTWRIVFELRDVGMPIPIDSMLVRAPTADDALTLFRVKCGSATLKVLDLSLNETMGPTLVNCPLCLRRWGEHLSARNACRFQRGSVLESQLDEAERKLLGLAPRPELG